MSELRIYIGNSVSFCILECQKLCSASGMFLLLNRISLRLLAATHIFFKNYDSIYESARTCNQFGLFGSSLWPRSCLLPFWFSWLQIVQVKSPLVNPFSQPTHNCGLCMSNLVPFGCVCARACFVRSTLEIEWTSG